MTNKDYEKIGHYLAKMYKIVNKYNFSKDEFCSDLINVINYFQKYDQEIYNAFFYAKFSSKEQIQQLNSRIKNFKEEKAVSSQLLNDLIKQKEELSKPNTETNLKNLIQSLKKSIQEIEYKVAVLNKKIVESVLNIDEESNLIEDLGKLEKEKKSKLNKVSELEQNLAEELERSEYYNIENTIEELETQVKDVENNLFQLYKDRVSKHKEFLKLYHDLKHYENLKKKVENNFRKNIIFIEHYDKIFKVRNNYDKDKLFREIYSKVNLVDIPRKKKIKSKKVKMIIKKRKLLKKLKEERLKRALDKKESGEKLGFYELKLIMDQEQKKKK